MKLKNYFEYIKDNPEKYWFKRKIYGWGWTPARWQGWFVTALFVSFILWSGVDLESNINPTENEVMNFFLRIIVSSLILITICYKTGEKPKWQWGGGDKK